jgi:hypothetical protein
MNLRNYRVVCAKSGANLALIPAASIWDAERHLLNTCPGIDIVDWRMSDGSLDTDTIAIV